MEADGLREYLAPTALFVCLVFGGYGVHSPLATTLCLLTALALLVFELVAWRPLTTTGRAALLILLAAVALPLLQLLPLPPSIWQRLPGRELLMETLSAVGLPTRQDFPLTFDRLATTEAALHLVPALALFLSAGRLGQDGQLRLLTTVLVVATISLAGAFLPSGRLLMLPNDLAVAATRFSGFFANHNHQSDFMLVGLVCAAGLFTLLARRGFLYVVALPFLGCAMMLGVLGTGSRMGLALLPLVLIACLIMIWRALGTRRGQRRRPWLPALALLAGISICVASFYLLPDVLRQMGIEDMDEPRLRAWPDVVWAIGNYFPAGTGMGTFEQIFRSAERLDNMSNIYMNEAHNEYLQVLLEGGAAGAALLALALVWYLAAGFRAWRRDAVLAQIGSIAVGVYLVHSLVDYPLRTIAHAALIGLFVALMSCREGSDRALRR